MDSFPSSDLIPRPDFGGVPQHTGRRSKLEDDAFPGRGPALEVDVTLEGGDTFPTNEVGRPSYDSFMVLVGNQPQMIVGPDATRTALTLTAVRVTGDTEYLVTVGHRASLSGGQGGAVLAPNVPTRVDTSEEVYATLSALAGVAPTDTAAVWVSVLVGRSR